MHEMFDSIAGSETGAIIATTLNVKNKSDTANIQENAFFANTFLEFMDGPGNDLYSDRKIPSYGQVLIVSLVAFAFGVPIYLFTEACFPEKLFEMRRTLLREYINHCKEATKLKIKVDDEDLSAHNQKKYQIEQEIE